MTVTLAITDGVPLAPRTTLGLGGPAQHFVAVTDEAELREALQWAGAHQHAVTVLGGGSNVVVADDGVAGLVVHLGLRGVVHEPASGLVRVRAAAGECWDDIVADAVAGGLAGIECLSGIPGSVGATPIQNVGAYGQEVGDVITRVRAFDRRSGTTAWIDRAACGFGYRSSVFKREPGRHVVLEVEYALRTTAPAAPRYAELQRAVGARPTLSELRAAVLALRRSKSMVLDADDDNRRSVGSFFTNPIVEAALAAEVERRASGPVPSWPQPDGRIKLAAAWLIEHSGTHKGERRGAVGVSSRHALALVHHGGGTTRALLAFADEIAARVHARFGVTLEREPVVLGRA